MVVIYITHSGSLIEIILVFIAHFLWDLAIMLMGDYFSLYQKTKNLKYEKYAIIAQSISFVIFGMIGLYAGLFWWKWAYFVPQILFIWPLLKGIWEFLKIKILEKIDYKLVAIVGFFVILWYFWFGLIHNIWWFIQVLWFVIFPLWLSITNHRWKYIISTIWIWFIFVGSFYELILWILDKNVSGVDVSYTLLPFTVLVFYLKNLKNFLKS